eukprot:5480637-Lingulodinium_polyedra.AAC.2
MRWPTGYMRSLAKLCSTSTIYMNTVQLFIENFIVHFEHTERVAYMREVARLLARLYPYPAPEREAQQLH